MASTSTFLPAFTTTLEPSDAPVPIGTGLRRALATGSPLTELLTLLWSEPTAGCTYCELPVAPLLCGSVSPPVIDDDEPVWPSACEVCVPGPESWPEGTAETVPSLALPS